MSDDNKNEAAKPAAVAPKRKNGAVVYDDGKGGLTEKAPASRPHKRKSLGGKATSNPAKK